MLYANVLGRQRTEWHHCLFAAIRRPSLCLDIFTFWLPNRALTSQHIQLVPSLSGPQVKMRQSARKAASVLYDSIRLLPPSLQSSGGRFLCRLERWRRQARKMVAGDINRGFCAAPHVDQIGHLSLGLVTDSARVQSSYMCWTPRETYGS